MSDRQPCPSCGETDTLELMRWKLERLEAIKDQRDYDDRTGKYSSSPTLGTGLWGGTLNGGNITITSGSGGYNSGVTIVGPRPTVPPEEPDWDDWRVHIQRPNGAECCANCGRFFNPYAAFEKKELEREIEELELKVLPPLELLAKAAGPNSEPQP